MVETLSTTLATNLTLNDIADILHYTDLLHTFERLVDYTNFGKCLV